jgi:uncharacterized DUF497 family protein
MIDFQRIEGFQWDDGNIYKNEKHGVYYQEAEQIFNGQILHVSFTLRDNDTKIRIISARKADKKERSIYEKKT